jgi:hypothetical protein
MSPRTMTAKRLASTTLLVVLGGAITVGAWLGGEPYLAVALGIFYAVGCLIAYVWSGRRGDVAALLRVDGDERQRQMDLRATAISGLAMGLFCIGAAAVDLARGGTGVTWALVCAVGGVSYVIALAVVRQRNH